MNRNLSRGRKRGRLRNPDWNKRRSGWQGTGARNERGLPPRGGRT